MGDDCKTCPQCTESIKVEAIKCRYCGTSLTPPASNLDFNLSRRTGFLLIGGIILASILVPLREPIFDLFRPKPLKVELAELERQFDKDAPAALATWRSKPVLVSATLSSSDGEDLALESIYPMAVHAKLNSPFAGEEGQKVRLHCREIEEGGLIGGKPRLVNCDVAP